MAKILVIDDDRMMRELCEEILTAAGMRPYSPKMAPKVWPGPVDGPT